jgi:thioredoxin 1
MLELNESNFHKTIENEEKPVVIDFWTSWCAPCRALAPKFAEWSGKYSDKAIFAKVNLDEATSLAVEYQVSAIPTIIVIKEGREAKRWLGIPNDKDIEKFLE